ncbi:hypothetical protein NPIL_172591 [Nephila pilipes]|uniref:Uncharacterized protein n=1 Tax=Nephila pilipes TaxID=299642 RepID=A0A8X6P716_NEPPI|nr:hypothetical protein NPIL_172591 [Nephila pilipes]
MMKYTQKESFKVLYSEHAATLTFSQRQHNDVNNFLERTAQTMKRRLFTSPWKPRDIRCIGATGFCIRSKSCRLCWYTNSCETMSQLSGGGFLRQHLQEFVSRYETCLNPSGPHVEA